VLGFPLEEFFKVDSFKVEMGLEVLTRAVAKGSKKGADMKHRRTKRHVVHMDRHPLAVESCPLGHVPGRAASGELDGKRRS